MKSSCDENKYIGDVNKHIEWDDVVSIEWCMEKEDCCPLCLMKHTAPRAIECGHCFCYACIQQFISLQSDNWMKCPVCSVLFEKNSLRPVKFLYTGKEVQVGDILTMNLVVRPSQCTNAFQPTISKLSYYLRHPIPLADAPDIEIRYCHLLYNSFSYEVTLLQQNLQELDDCEKEMNAVGETYLLNTMQSIRQELLSRIHILHSVLTEKKNNSAGESVYCLSSLSTSTSWNQSGGGMLSCASLDNVCSIPLPIF